LWSFNQVDVEVFVTLEKSSFRSNIDPKRNEGVKGEILKPKAAMAGDAFIAL
jgi:hypothetical protein